MPKFHSSHHHPPSLLDSTTPIVDTPKPPVIVVGLPRSGSSFLSHVLSFLDDWYVFDDLYPYQKALAVGANPFLTPSQLTEFVSQLCWAARAKIKWEKNFRIPKCTLEDVDRLETAVCNTFVDRTVTWPQVLEEWMMRLALLHGCNRWGYKTPQDFMHLDTLAEIFPDARFVFIMRDPRQMMASMKNLKKHVGGDGNPHQYHPVAYSLYWKTAFNQVRSFIKTGKALVHVVPFEDLIESPDQFAQSLAEFLNTTVSQSIETKGANSSFPSGSRQRLTPSECWLCERLAGDSMLAAGYKLSGHSLQWQDCPDLARTTWLFIRYQFQRLIRNKRSRQSVMSYLKTLKTELFKSKAALSPPLE
ncbi:MAG: sulfotransferase [Cyanobacteria bacterium P01_G01_bin.4]